MTGILAGQTLGSRRTLRVYRIVIIVIRSCGGLSCCGEFVGCAAPPRDDDAAVDGEEDGYWNCPVTVISEDVVLQERIQP